ncbi:unnamed protein product [Arabidopsis thaliana]|uniref:(thale cress) hypothetical protein n=1 Tax=Arabidopsis thaliana TaxID=3702 RepID=A0A7G2FLG9_ARATH|nr:unnamed protein product [Arabidopsis thaliana]
MVDKREEVMHVAMFPWLAMGHLLPFLRLSKLLAQKGHKISFISTPRNIERLPKLQSNLASSITFVSFPLPPISGLPPSSESSMDVPYNKQQSLKAAFDLLQPPLKEFLRRSSPDWIIYDYASHWLPSIAAELGISKAFFSLFNAATLCFMGPASSLIEEIRSTPEDFTVVPPWVPFKSNIVFRYHEVTRYVEKTEEDVTGVSDSVRFGYSIDESDAVFVRSCPEFEPEWFGLLKDLYRKPVFPIGFLPPVIEDDDAVDTTWVRIKKWLDKQRLNSVVYVSLGTEASLRHEEVTELALGLVMIDDAGEEIRAKAKVMKDLFGNMDENIRYVDELVRCAHYSLSEFFFSGQGLQEADEDLASYLPVEMLSASADDDDDQEPLANLANPSDSEFDLPSSFD